jgi:hypothetical protein
MTLKELLKDWEDQDICAYYLACSLGLIEYDESWTVFRENKYIFWSNNPTSEFLYEALRKMAEVQMLEFDDDETRYRWNKEFKPT